MTDKDDEKPVMTKDEKKFVADEVGKAFGEDPPGELALHVRRSLLHPKQGVHIARIPIALVVRDVSEGESKECKAQPFVRCRAVALVVNRNTAKYFDLAAFGDRARAYGFDR